MLKLRKNLQEKRIQFFKFKGGWPLPPPPYAQLCSFQEITVILVSSCGKFNRANFHFNSFLTKGYKSWCYACPNGSWKYQVSNYLKLSLVRMISYIYSESLQCYIKMLLFSALELYFRRYLYCIHLLSKDLNLWQKINGQLLS